MFNWFTFPTVVPGFCQNQLWCALDKLFIYLTQICICFYLCMLTCRSADSYFVGYELYYFLTVCLMIDIQKCMLLEICKFESTDDHHFTFVFIDFFIKHVHLYILNADGREVTFEVCTG